MIQWKNSPVDVRTLCSRPVGFPFPVLARIPAEEDESEPSPTGAEDNQGHDGGSSGTHPVSYLLYAVRNCTKVSGTSLRWDDEERTLKQNGINYVIPLNYPGWFRLLSGDGKSQTHLVPLTTIEQVVASKSNRFLVHSSVTGLWPDQSSSTATSGSFLEVRVPPGEVLSCGPIFVEAQETLLGTLRCCLCPLFSGRNKSEALQNEKMYLQCRGTTSGIDVLLSLDTYGQFSCIGTGQRSDHQDEGEDSPAATSRPPPVVYQMKDLINRKDFPQELQLVYGTPPPQPPPSANQSRQSFTSLMALGRTYSERSIIACQITGGGDGLAFVEFPEDSEVEFLLAENWEGNASARKAVDFCQKHCAAYELEIQPIVGSIRPQEIHSDILSRDSAGVFGCAKFCKASPEEIIRPESTDSEIATIPTFLQLPTQRLQSGVSDIPAIPQRRTKTPVGFQRSFPIPYHRAQSTATPLPAASRSRVKSTGWRHEGQKSPDNKSCKDDIIVKVHAIAANSTQRVQNAGKPIQNSSERNRGNFAIDQRSTRFTKSLERHRRNLEVIAQVHRPPLRPSRNLSRSKSELNEMQPITRYSLGRMTDRKLPPLPSQTDVDIANAGESNHGFQRSSSEVESNASDPERLYERIPCQLLGISNEPSPSAPSSPAPTIRHRHDETPTPVSPFAYDQDGYLTPVERRDIGSVQEKGWNVGSLGSTGNCKKKLGQNFYSSHRRYIASQMDRIPVNNSRYNSDRLQSFLDDSVAELYRKQLHREDSERTVDNGSRERRYQRNNLSDNTSRKRPHSLTTTTPPDSQDLPREEADVSLETILDCEDAEPDDQDEEEEYSLRFLRSVSTNLRMRRPNPAATASYHGVLDSAAFSDSGIASRQSTMRIGNGELVFWKSIQGLWTPPTDLSTLSVEEVAMSLRYIGMKDQVAVSFSKEQVDGKLLCEMNNHLLREGFPNMNSLERKKVMDFVQGWRPKRLLFI